METGPAATGKSIQPTDPQGEWVPLGEAASRLGISIEAVRVKVRQRSLFGHLEGRRGWVFMPPASSGVDPHLDHTLHGTEAISNTQSRSHQNTRAGLTNRGRRLLSQMSKRFLRVIGSVAVIGLLFTGISTWYTRSQAVSAERGVNPLVHISEEFESNDPDMIVVGSCRNPYWKTPFLIFETDKVFFVSNNGGRPVSLVKAELHSGNRLWSLKVYEADANPYLSPNSQNVPLPVDIPSGVTRKWRLFGSLHQETTEPMTYRQLHDYRLGSDSIRWVFTFTDGTRLENERGYWLTAGGSGDEEIPFKASC